MDPQYPDGDVVDTDMKESLSFDGEFEVGDEHEELGRVDFEPIVVDLAPESMGMEAAEPMDIKDDQEQDPKPEIESEENMSFDEDLELSESASESSGSNPN